MEKITNTTIPKSFISILMFVTSYMAARENSPTNSRCACYVELISNLFVSMLDAFGTPVERFADSTGPLAGLLNT